MSGSGMRWTMDSGRSARQPENLFPNSDEEDEGSDSGSPEELWVVEQVLAKRIRNGEIQYLLKWKDWDQ
jgi:hypothetical protein